ncbi:MAG: YihY/virulence factor BrkB family protein [Candidatus Aminicenantes bacterium]
MKNIFGTARQVLKELKRKRAVSLAASVSFFAFLSLFPFFLLTITIAGFFIKKSAALAKVEESLRAFPKGIAESFISSLQGMIDAGGVISAVSFLFLIYSSFMVFVQLRAALNRIMGLKKTPKGWLAILKTFSFFLITAFLAVILALSGSALFVMARKLGNLPLVKSYYFIWPAYVLVEGLFLSFSYRYLSSRTLAARHVLTGGFVAAGLWEILKHLFGLYVNSIDALSALYGSIGSIILLQLWLFYSFLIYFAGAQICLTLSQASRGDAEEYTGGSPHGSE